MRLLLINSSRKWIGEAAHTLTLARLLREAGHKVYVGCRRGRMLEDALVEAELERLPLTLNGSFYPRLDFKDVRVIHRFLRRRKIQIVHCHRSKEHWLAAMALLGRSRRKRPALVRTRHVVTPLRQHIFNHWLYRRATDGVIGVSEAAMCSFGDLRPHLPQRRVHIIHGAVDSEKFNPGNRDEELRRDWGVAGGGVMIGLVARFQRIKGQRPFLEAAARVARNCPKARFLLFGRNVQKHQKTIRKWLGELALTEKVVIEMRQLPIENVIASLDIGVVASLGSEGFSRIGTEYMASGLPVVATSVGALPEIVIDGETGFLVPPERPATMATCLEPLCRDAAERARLGANARRVATEYFHPQRFLEETLDFYRLVLPRS